jgi:hypothetical protein
MRAKPSFIGSVKWRAAPLGREVYANLAGHASALGVDETIPWIFIGRGGVEPSLLRAHTHAIGFSARDLYEGESRS